MRCSRSVFAHAPLCFVSLVIATGACIEPRSGLHDAAAPPPYLSVLFDPARVVTFVTGPPARDTIVLSVLEVGGRVVSARSDTLVLDAMYLTRYDSAELRTVRQAARDLHVVRAVIASREGMRTRNFRPTRDLSRRARAALVVVGVAVLGWYYFTHTHW